jgi:small subunit ribosomal protein S16
MAVKIRLRRVGKKKVPSYRVVVADGRSPRDGRFIEQIGRYEPLQDPSIVEIDNDRALDWLHKGAQPTDAVRKLLEISGAWGRFRAAKGEIHTVGDPVAPPPPKKKTSKKDRARAEAAADGEDAAPASAEAGSGEAEAPPEPEAGSTEAKPEPEVTVAAEPEPEAAAEPEPAEPTPESDAAAPEPEESPTEEEQS